jgi:hypothetical protein
MTGLTYTPGALAAAQQGSAAMWQLHRAALLRGQTPLVIAPVLACAPGPSPALEALLAGCTLVDFPVSAARDVSRVRRLVPGTDLVTAAVVLTALAARAAVVCDASERLAPLADALGADLRTIAIPAE